MYDKSILIGKTLKLVKSRKAEKNRSEVYSLTKTSLMLSFLQKILIYDDVRKNVMPSLKYFLSKKYFHGNRVN